MTSTLNALLQYTANNKTCGIKCKKQQQKNKNIGIVVIEGYKNQVDKNTKINRAFKSGASKNVCGGHHLEIISISGTLLTLYR